MHILLTDVVTCPRCGPEFGLIVLADHIEDRHVLAGSLGCANCREEFPVRAGVADLRWPLAGDADDRQDAPSSRSAPDAERPYRVAALLGITGPSAPVALITDDPDLVEAVQGHLPHVVVVGVSAAAPAGGGEIAGGWLRVGDALPFRSRSLGGAVISSADPDPLVEEVLRCVGREGRVVVDPAGPGTGDVLRRHGADLLLEQDEVAVASDPRAG